MPQSIAFLTYTQAQPAITPLENAQDICLAQESQSIRANLANNLHELKIWGLVLSFVSTNNPPWELALLHGVWDLEEWSPGTR